MASDESFTAESNAVHIRSWTHRTNKCLKIRAMQAPALCKNVRLSSEITRSPGESSTDKPIQTDFQALSKVTWALDISSFKPLCFTLSWKSSGSLQVTCSQVNPTLNKWVGAVESHCSTACSSSKPPSTIRLRRALNRVLKAAILCTQSLEYYPRNVLSQKWFENVKHYSSFIH